MTQTSTRFDMLLPVPETPIQGLPLAPRLSSLRGKTVGFIDNGWRSLGLTLDLFEELLYERHEVAGIIKKKTAAGVPLTKEEFADMASKADAVICGLGN